MPQPKAEPGAPFAGYREGRGPHLAVPTHEITGERSMSNEQQNNPRRDQQQQGNPQQGNPQQGGQKPQHQQAGQKPGQQ